VARYSSANLSGGFEVGLGYLAGLEGIHNYAIKVQPFLREHGAARTDGAAQGLPLCAPSAMVGLIPRSACPRCSTEGPQEEALQQLINVLGNPVGAYIHCVVQLPIVDGKGAAALDSRFLIESDPCSRHYNKLVMIIRQGCGTVRSRLW
jgi:hypothetical protein